MVAGQLSGELSSFGNQLGMTRHGTGGEDEEGANTPSPCSVLLGHKCSPNHPPYSSSSSSFSSRIPFLLLSSSCPRSKVVCLARRPPSRSVNQLLPHSQGKAIGSFQQVYQAHSTGAEIRIHFLFGSSPMMKSNLWIRTSAAAQKSYEASLRFGFMLLADSRSEQTLCTPPLHPSVRASPGAHVGVGWGDGELSSVVAIPSAHEGWVKMEDGSSGRD
ncbi:hypothetical protein INR49_029278 [Caranx melampygus]|nr:hypothetical protein INR49_029278 [Caranx melampygus]